MKCPKCAGTLTRDFEQPSCINCGFVLYQEAQTAKAWLEALPRYEQNPGRGKAKRVAHHNLKKTA